MKAMKMVFVFVFLLLAAPMTALGQYHELGFGEPYELAGKRMVFTTWYWVRPGQFDWVNDEGKSVFAKRDVKALPGDPHVHWKEIDIPRGVQLAVEKAVKGQFPIKPEHPWEAEGIQITSLCQVEDKIMAWGICKPGGNCYFESTDGGKTWIRPKLGLVEFDGSKENNLGGNGSFRGYYDRNPAAPPEERFKSASNAEWTHEEFEKHYKGKRPYSQIALEISPEAVQSVWGYTSPDGLNWTRSEQPLIVDSNDGGQYVFWDPKIEKYVLIVRAHMIGPRAEGFEPHVEDEFENYYKSTIRLGIGRSESPNFREFPLSETIINTANDMPPTDVFQFCLYTSVPNAPDHHLMFPTRWKMAEDQCVIDLYTSYDGKKWNRAAETVVGTSNWGEWDGGSVWGINPGLIELHNGDWILPYRGDLLTTRYPRGHITQGWGAAIWPKGRLMAVESPGEGYFATVAVVAPGTTVRINALTQATGEIRVEAADLHGRPIAGRTFADSIPIVGDHHRSLIKWKDAEDLGVKAGEPVMLRFRMDRAKIYGLDFE